LEFGRGDYHGLLHYPEILRYLTIPEILLIIGDGGNQYHVCHNMQLFQIRFQSRIEMILFNMDKLFKHNMLRCVLTRILTT